MEGTELAVPHGATVERRRTEDTSFGRPLPRANRTTTQLSQRATTPFVSVPPFLLLNRFLRVLAMPPVAELHTLSRCFDKASEQPSVRRRRLSSAVARSRSSA